MGPFEIALRLASGDVLAPVHPAEPMLMDDIHILPAGLLFGVGLEPFGDLHVRVRLGDHRQQDRVVRLATGPTAHRAGGRRQSHPHQDMLPEFVHCAFLVPRALRWAASSLVIPPRASRSIC